MGTGSQGIKARLLKVYIARYKPKEEMQCSGILLEARAREFWVVAKRKLKRKQDARNHLARGDLVKRV